MNVVRAQFDHLTHSQTARLLVLGLLVGAASAYGAIAFRFWIAGTQFLAFGVFTENLGSHAATLEPWRIYAALMGGGLIIGLLLRYLPLNQRPHGVADVIEAAHFRAGQMGFKQGLSAALVSATSLGVGASAGREGPVVHLGASLASALATKLHLPPHAARTLLGCGIAAAVAASFNAPLAGAIFAHELVLGHFALRSFAPIVISSVAGTVICRLHIGELPAFIIPDYAIHSAFEYPAFALLGLMCGAFAALFVRLTLATQAQTDKLPVPLVFRPVLGGAVVATIALGFPQVLGVGYEATDMALKEEFPLFMLVALLVAKIAATAISLGFRFGGGVFSPGLYFGAMAGGAFGIVATTIVPDIGQSYGVYALAGMGAVAGAVLGAPLSTILMVFEMTGDYQLTTAVMIAVVVSSITAQGLDVPGYFTRQLIDRGRKLEGGLARARARLVGIKPIIDKSPIIIPAALEGTELIEAVKDAALHPDIHPFVITDDENRPLGLVLEADIVRNLFMPAEDLKVEDIIHDVKAIGPEDSVEHAIALMKAAQLPALPVAENGGTGALIGLVREADALSFYTDALEEAEMETAGERLLPRSTHGAK